MTAQIIPHYSGEPKPKGQLWARVAESGDAGSEWFVGIANRPLYTLRIALAMRHLWGRAMGAGGTLAEAVKYNTSNYPPYRVGGVIVARRRIK